MIVRTPTGGLSIEKSGEDGKHRFLACFGLVELPPIKFFGNKIMKEDLPDDMFIKCFLVVLLSTFLCPTSSTYPSTKYLGSLVDIDKIKEMDWSKLTHDWMMNCIKKYQKQQANLSRLSCTLGGCIYSLAVRCLDQFDFRNIDMAQTLPRILIWKGEMISDFCKMYLLKSGKYAACAVKKELDTCYRMVDVSNSRETSLTDLRFCIESLCGQFLSQEVKHNISLIFEKYMESKNEDQWQNAKELVIDVLRTITTVCNVRQKENHGTTNNDILWGSQGTEEVKDSNNNSDEHQNVGVHTNKAESSEHNNNYVETEAATVCNNK